MNMIRIEFESQTPYGLFKDSLVLPENHGMTEEQIEKLKADSVQAFIDAFTAEPAPPEGLE